YFVVISIVFFFFQAEDGIRGFHVTGVQTCALPILVSFRFRFVVEKDGTLTNFEVEGTENEVHEQLAEQIIEIMKESGNWTPAQHEGKIVSSTFVWKVTFRLH